MKTEGQRRRRTLTTLTVANTKVKLQTNCTPSLTISILTIRRIRTRIITTTNLRRINDHLRNIDTLLRRKLTTFSLNLNITTLIRRLPNIMRLKDLLGRLRNLNLIRLCIIRHNSTSRGRTVLRVGLRASDTQTVGPPAQRGRRWSKPQQKAPNDPDSHFSDISPGHEQAKRTKSSLPQTSRRPEPRTPKFQTTTPR